MWVRRSGISSTFLLKHLSSFLKRIGYLEDTPLFWMFLWSNTLSVFFFFSFYLHFHLLLWQKQRCTHSIKQLSHMPATLRFLLLSKKFPRTVFIAKDPINISGANILFAPRGFIKRLCFIKSNAIDLQFTSLAWQCSCNARHTTSHTFIALKNVAV